MILALDIATCVGWCAGVGDALPQVGHWKLPPSDQGERGPTFSTFRRKLIDKLDEVRPRLVMFEAPILPKPFLKAGRIIYPTSVDTTTLLQGLAAIPQLECWDRLIPTRQVQPNEVKKELAGTGRADKPDMVAAARKVGLTIEVHDEADAFGVWLVAVRYHAKRFSPEWDRKLWSAKGALL